MTDLRLRVGTERQEMADRIDGIARSQRQYATPRQADERIRSGTLTKNAKELLQFFAMGHVDTPRNGAEVPR